jgi:signal transduction histidine kinase
MVIGVLFSFWVYDQARQELRFGLNRQDLLTAAYSLPPDDFQDYVQDRLDDSRNRLIARLVGFNAVLLVVGAAGSYWLARRTMQPIEESVESQHRFTADASHELRTPLAAMKAEIEVGLRDKKMTKDEAIELLQSNLEEVDRLGGLAEGLLTLTQTDNIVTPVPVSLEEVAAKVTKRLRPLAEANKITIMKNLAPVIVQSDEPALDKIIGILLDNAIKYSPENTKIIVSTYQKDNHVYVKVRDHGIGIKASELPHIFDRFYRADTSRTKQKAAGHGLGLSIAQKLAENINGKLTVVSTPGKGSTFTLRLTQ